MQFSKSIDLDDFSANELTPYLDAITHSEMALFGIENPPIVCDSLNWRAAMTLYSFDAHRIIEQGKTFAQIGTISDHVIDFLRNKGAVVFPIHSYSQCLTNPIATFVECIQKSSYCVANRSHESNTIPVFSDPRALELPSNFFDGVYTSGIMETAGSLDAVEAIAAEIGRILKPGGIASICTLLRLEGPDQTQWFDNRCMLFTPSLIKEHLIKASGLNSIGFPNNEPSAKTYQTRQYLIDFLNLSHEEATPYDKIVSSSSLISFQDGFLFCPVHILLSKPLEWKPAATTEAKINYFRKIIQANKRRDIDSLRELKQTKSSSQNTKESKIAPKGILGRILYKIDESLKRKPHVRQAIRKMMLPFPRVIVFLRNKMEA